MRALELKNLLVDEGKAAIEADFVGTHTGEFAGVAPTGRAVRVPYSVIYDLRGDQISALRIYLPHEPAGRAAHHLTGQRRAGHSTWLIFVALARRSSACAGDAGVGVSRR